ncbi:hypothetical protein PAPYR_11425 [Paratrimastix pyriformis]|uniref:Uncharacterized protein n=1 Tax=Paratrimastix pyriformis TaxID=342808 RepID=A0ABQ8U8Q2_9EUKA|nr:hypothetical protein PAPYR_11425 [Paratrimastix pyriformis]
MHPRVSHTGIEAPAKLAVSGCSSDIMCAVTPTPEGGSVLAYDRHPKTGTLADLHRWLSHEGDPLYIRMPYANGCIYPQGAALLADGALLHGSTKSWCFSGAGLCAHHVLGSVLADHLALSQHHHHHTLHQFDVFSGRNLCAHRVLVHQDIRLMPPSSWGFAGGGVRLFMPAFASTDAFSRRAVPLCRKQRQHSAPFGATPAHAGDTVEWDLIDKTPSMHLHSGVGVVFPLPPLSLTRRAPPGAGRDPLEEMFGVRMVDHESLFFVFFETFGSSDSQLDCFTALRGTDSLPTVLCVGGWRVVVRMGLCLKDESTAGTDMTCQILLIKFLDVSAVLRACCASVHSFLVWVCLGKRLLGYPTKLL